MAGWTYNQNFDGLSTGNLGGQDSYTLGGGTVTVTAAFSHSASQSVKFATNASNYVKRAVTAVTTDGAIMYFSAMTNNTALGGSLYFYLWGAGDGASRVMDIEVNGVTVGATTWNFRNEAGTRSSSLGNISSGVWANFAVEFDWTNDRCRGSINGGAMSAYFSMSTPRSQMDYMWLQGGSDAGTNDFYVDDFRDTPYPSGAVGPANVKTWDGITQSSGIKTYGALALASVKTFNGVT